MGFANQPNQSLGFLLHDVQRLLRRNFARRTQHLGLTQAQWQTLAYLARCEGINQAKLAELLDIQPITLTRQIDRLEASNLVERQRDPDDRRAVRLYLTEAATPLLESLWAFAEETREDALAGVSAQTRETLIQTLQEMRRNLSDCDAEARRPFVGKEKSET
ncbi:MarR family winged helix-turn-helix transcriptional regulator [Rhodovibrio salinarum]|uniref:MarR family transcriptional regulator n=1 Tax=Rhodovibrio salinarum TaxID=1087 RepID=A0A934V0D3_9PROT|nr:MarR family transcriptional regulator [Rhodovibrio salinarum]MBK1697300.1 MarR family transcriptional regulator [Rhodovibrio salinarum]